MTKQFKHPCAVALEGLTQEQGVKLEEAFVKLGADEFDRFSSNWDFYGVDWENDVVLHDSMVYYSDNNNESEVTLYTYQEVMELAGMSESTTLESDPNHYDWIENTGTEPQFLLDGGIIDVMFEGGEIIRNVTNKNRDGDGGDYSANTWGLFGGGSQIKRWRKSSIITSKEDSSESSTNVAVDVQSVSESNTESFNTISDITLSVSFDSKRFTTDFSNWLVDNMDNLVKQFQSEVDLGDYIKIGD